MLQIKSFGTKEDCCQATQPEQGYQGNRGDPKLDLRNEVALVVHRHTRNTQTRTSTSLPHSIAFKVRPTNANRQQVSSGKCTTQRKCHPVAQTKSRAFNQQGFLKLRGYEVRRLMDSVSQNQQLVKHNT